jgi:hypothetical protein
LNKNKNEQRRTTLRGYSRAKKIILGIKEIEDFDKKFILEPLEQFGFSNYISKRE